MLIIEYVLTWYIACGVYMAIVSLMYIWQKNIVKDWEEDRSFVGRSIVVIAIPAYLVVITATWPYTLWRIMNGKRP